MKKEPMVWGILVAACVSCAAVFTSHAQDDTALEEAYGTYEGEDPYADDGAYAEEGSSSGEGADPYSDEGAYADDGADPYADDGAAAGGDDAYEDEDEGDDEVADDGDSGKAERPVAEVKPRPAEIMPLTVKSLLLDVAQADGRLIAVGDRGAIMHSSDGRNWKQVPVPTRAAFTAVSFGDAQHGWAVGHDAAIVATTDGGNTWKLQNFEPEIEQPFLDVLALDAQRAFVVGSYGMFRKTEDGGQTWTAVEAPDVRGEELHFNAITRLANGHLLLSGEAGMMGLSEDEGVTWKRLESPYESSLFGALPHGEAGALVYGLRGNAYITDDVSAGEWTVIETGSVASMFGGAVLPDGRFAMVGSNGVILITDSSGQIQTFTAPAGTPLSAALAYKDGLMTVGESGVQPVTLN